MAGHCIPNSRIAIDLWDDESERKIHFLTHFHETQLVGLTSKWSNTIYTSEINAVYLKKIIKVNPRCVKVLKKNKLYTIVHKHSQESFTVGVMNANHCPGSLMFLFEGSFGRILYTGHFRYKPSMLKNPVLARVLTNKNLDVIFLDNTYAACECQFPSDVECLKQIIEIIRANNTRKVVLALMEEDEPQALGYLVKVLGKKILVSKEKYQMTQKLIDGVNRNWFTDDPSKSLIHAVEFSSLGVKRDNDKSVVTILLTLEYQFGGKIFDSAGQSDVYVIPYSTHSSHSDLASFVSQLRPRHITPIVVETDSVYSVIPKQLHDLCEVQSSNPSPGKALKRVESSSIVDVVESTLKQKALNSKKKLSFDINLVRSEKEISCVDAVTTDSCINGLKMCSSRDDGSIEILPVIESVITSESNECLVPCSSVSCEIQSEKCNHKALQKLSAHLPRHSNVAVSTEVPGASNQSTSPFAFNDVIIEEESKEFEDDEFSLRSKSPDTTELNSSGLLGTTLQVSVDSSQTNCKVSLGVQTEDVYQTKIHEHSQQFSYEKESFLPSVFVLPNELKRRLKLSLCDCDACMAGNKRKYSGMFTRQTQSECEENHCVAVGSNDLVKLCTKSLPGKPFAVHSEICDKANTIKDIILDDLVLNTNSELVDDGKEQIHGTRDQGSELYKVGPVLSRSELPVTCYKSDMDSVNMTVSKMLFLNKLNLNIVCRSRSSEKPDHVDMLSKSCEDVQKLNQTHLNGCASDVGVSRRKKTFVNNINSLKKNTSCNVRSKQILKELSLYNSRDSRRVNRTLDSAQFYENTKCPKTALTSFKQKQIKVKKGTNHNKSKATSKSKPFVKNLSKVSKGSQQKDGCNNNLVPYISQVKSKRQEYLEEDMFVSDSSDLSRSSNSHSDTFYSAVSIPVASIAEKLKVTKSLMDDKIGNSTPVESVVAQNTTQRMSDGQVVNMCQCRQGGIEREVILHSCNKGSSRVCVRTHVKEQVSEAKINGRVCRSSNDTLTRTLQNDCSVLGSGKSQNSRSRNKRNQCSIFYGESDDSSCDKMDCSKQPVQKLSLRTGRDTSSIHLIAECSREPCNRKRLRVTLTRLKPEQIKGYNCTAQKVKKPKV